MSPFEIKDLLRLIFKHCNYPPSLLTILLLNKNCYNICKGLMPEKLVELIKYHIDANGFKKTYYSMIEGTNKKHGRFEVKNSDRSIVRGSYHYGKPHGEWRTYAYPYTTFIRNYNMGKLEGKLSKFKRKNMKKYNMICKEIDYKNDRKNGRSYKYYEDKDHRLHVIIPQKITKYIDGKKNDYQLIFQKFDSKIWLYKTQQQINNKIDQILQNPERNCDILQRTILWDNGKKVAEYIYDPYSNGLHYKTLYYVDGMFKKMVVYSRDNSTRIIQESVVDDKREFVKNTSYNFYENETKNERTFRLRDFETFLK